MYSLFLGDKTTEIMDSIYCDEDDGPSTYISFNECGSKDEKSMVVVIAISPSIELWIFGSGTR